MSDLRVGFVQTVRHFDVSGGDGAVRRDEVEEGGKQRGDEPTPQGTGNEDQGGRTQRIPRPGLQRGGGGGVEDQGVQLKGFWKSSMMLRMLTYVPMTNVNTLPTKMTVFRIVLNSLERN
eukprot:scaffold1821_cov344-Pavlova_lutheri.AAC.19